MSRITPGDRGGVPSRIKDISLQQFALLPLSLVPSVSCEENIFPLPSSPVSRHRIVCVHLVDALLCNYNAALSRMINRHAPLKEKTLRARPRVPWYNADIDNAKRIRRKAKRRWRKTKLLSDLIIFKSKKNHVTYLMNQGRQVFYTKFIYENSVDQGKLFRATKRLLRERMSYLIWKNGPG